MRVSFHPGPLLAIVTAAVVALAVTPASAQRGPRTWWQRTTPLWSQHYLIKTDLSTGEARAYGRHLDRMYEEYSRRLASLAPRGPEELRVYIFRSRDDYLRTLRARWDIDASGTGGMFFVDPAGGGLAFWTESLPRQRILHVIQHEGFHQFAYSRFGTDLPVWLNEGLAEFFGEAVLVGGVAGVGGEFVLGQSTPRVVDTVRKAVERDEHMPFLAMLRMTNAQWGERLRSGRAAVLYHQSWSMVHFLVYGDGQRYRLHFERYLRLINRGIHAEPAFVQVFGDDIDGFEERWKMHATAARPSGLVTALERIEFLAEGAIEVGGYAGAEDLPAIDSLESLRRALVKLDFTHTIDRHGHVVRLAAKDEENFTIPADDLTTDAPRFVITPASRSRGLARRERLQETQHPTPVTIRTEHLEPRDLAVRWIRDHETGAVRYEIEAMGGS